MNRSSILAVLLGLSLAACTDGSTSSTGQSLACYDTGHGMMCTRTAAITKVAADVDHDGTDDRFVCGDTESASEGDSRSDSDGTSDSESNEHCHGGGGGDSTSDDPSASDSTVDSADSAGDDSVSDGDDDGVPDGMDCDCIPPPPEPAPTDPGTTPPA